MSEVSNPAVSISVDLKKYRIRVHKSTLALLGIPKYVQLLVSPTEMMFAIQGVDSKSRDSHRVNLEAIQPDNSFELYSKAFVGTLCSLVPNLDSGCTYRLTGEVLSEENAAVFSLSTLQKVDALEDRE